MKQKATCPDWVTWLWDRMDIYIWGSLRNVKTQTMQNGAAEYELECERQETANF